MKKAIIIGATSGIGLEVARLLLRRGWRIGVAGRREEALQALRSTAPEQVETARINVTRDDAPERLRALIDRLGGMDLFFLSSGIGYQNPTLDPNIELRTARTNVEGFTRMTTAAFDYRPRADCRARADTSPSSAPSQAPRGWEPHRLTRPPNAFRTPTSTLWSSWPACSTCASASPTSVRAS